MGTMANSEDSVEMPHGILSESALFSNSNLIFRETYGLIYKVLLPKGDYSVI